MQKTPLMMCAVVALVIGFMSPGATAGERAAAAFEEGRAALAKAEFADAYRAFANAAKLEPDNAEYRAEAALLRRIMLVRKKLDRISDPQQWQAASVSLHTYYYEHGVYSEALTVDRELAKRVKQADTAVLLARTLLKLERFDEAAQVLEPWAELGGDEHARVLHGLALARAGQTKAAQAIAATVAVAADCPPDMALDVARLRVTVDDADGALRALRHCLEVTLPSRMAYQRSAITACDEFTPLARGEALLAVLKTDSAVKESDCSSGTSCGSCPSRATCAGAGEKEE